MGWEIVVGIESHTQLLTQSKMFSGASTAFGAAPNTQLMRTRNFAWAESSRSLPDAPGKRLTSPLFLAAARTPAAILAR